MKRFNLIFNKCTIIFVFFSLFLLNSFSNTTFATNLNDNNTTQSTISLTDQLFQNLKINAKVNLPKGRAEEFTENNIVFYNPTGTNNCSPGSNYISGSCGGDITSNTVEEREEEVIRKYGEIAMKLQIEYGIPWEIIFGQMRMESQFGLASNSVAGNIAKSGYYNWLGMKYSETSLYNMPEYYTSSSGKWSKYSSIGNMMGGWTLDYMRNGLYDRAFQYLDKDHYDIKQWFLTMVSVYCPASDGCINHETYWKVVNGVVQKADTIAKEMGWPTSAELAKQQNIEIGGKHPINGNLKKQLGLQPHSLNIDCTPSNSTTLSNSNPSSPTSSNKSNLTVSATWKDGWITSGIDGYVKEDAYAYAASNNITVGSAPRGEYDTTTKDGKIGPNKITLHNTEGTNRDAESGIILYDLNNFYPAHFTVDLKKHRTYQHFSINKPSDAIKEYDASAGIQIEIIGYSTSGNTNSPWYLLNQNNFKDEDWNYLAKLLTAISVETKIPLTTSVSWEGIPTRLSKEAFKSYEGILAHMHAPSPNDHNDTNNIWPMIEKALKNIKVNSNPSSNCNQTSTSTSDYQGLPAYLQCDPRWAKSPFGTSTICRSGCGPTSFAMIATVLLKQEISPIETAKYAGDQGMYKEGSGSLHKITRVLAEHYNLQYKKVPTPANASQAIEIINKYLDDGWMLHISGKGKKPFSVGGHYIAIHSRNSDGKWVIFNSSSKEDLKHLEWEPSDLVSAGLNLSNINAVKK